MSRDPQREGGDIKLKLKIWITGTYNDDREAAKFDLSEKLLAARWSDILDQSDYHDKRTVVLETGIDDPRIRDRIATANGKVQSAQRKHDDGDYPGAVVDCRQAIETLQSIDEVRTVVHDRKYDDFKGIMGKFEKGFAGGLSHAEEMTEITPALRRDSEFALNFTKACLRYATTALEEGSSS